MSLSPAGIEVQILSRGSRAPLPIREVRRILGAAAAALGAPRGEMALLWTDDRGIRALNRSFRGRDRATDVLSFPDGRGEGRARARIGDIVISVPAARRNARRAGRPLAQETRDLILHGFLHLLGYDHEVDGGEMMALQASLASALGTRRGAKVGR